MPLVDAFTGSDWSARTAVIVLLSLIISLYSMWTKDAAESQYDSLRISIYSDLFQESLLLSAIMAIPMAIDVTFEVLAVRTKGSSDQMHCAIRVLILFGVTVPNIFLLTTVHQPDKLSFLALRAFINMASRGGVFIFLSQDAVGVGMGKPCFIAALFNFIGGMLLEYRTGSFGILTAGVLMTVMTYLSLLYSTIIWLRAWRRSERPTSADDISIGTYIFALLLVGAGSLIISAAFQDMFYSNPSPLRISLETYNYMLFLLIAMKLSGRVVQFKLAEASKTNEEREAFVRYISHEIRTPLNTVFLGMTFIKSELELLQKQVPSSILVGPIIEAVEEAGHSCTVALEIVNDLLTFDKLKGGKFELEFEETEIKTFVEDTVKAFHLHARQKNISLSTTIHGDWTELYAMIIDSNKLGQVLRNLLSNALKFTPANGSVIVNVRKIGEILRESDSQSTTNFQRNLGGSSQQAPFRRGGSISQRIEHIAMSIEQQMTFKRLEIVKTDVKLQKCLSARPRATLKRRATRVAPQAGSDLLANPRSQRRSTFSHDLEAHANTGAGVSASTSSGAGAIVGSTSPRVDPEGSLQPPISPLSPAPQSVQDSNGGYSNSEKDYFIRIEVVDTGAGISPENQKLLFQQYMQFNASKLQKGGGSGLGLWISKGIVELHGGRLGAYSEGEGKGCTFFIELPLVMKSFDEDEVIEGGARMASPSPGEHPQTCTPTQHPRTPYVSRHIASIQERHAQTTTSPSPFLNDAALLFISPVVPSSAQDVRRLSSNLSAKARSAKNDKRINNNNNNNNSSAKGRRVSSSIPGVEAACSGSVHGEGSLGSLIRIAKSLISRKNCVRDQDICRVSRIRQANTEPNAQTGVTGANRRQNQGHDSRVEQNVMPQQQQSVGEMPTSSKPPCVLVVDDSSVTRKMMSRVLHQKGFLVIEAIDGCDCLEIVEKGKAAAMQLPRPTNLGTSSGNAGRWGFDAILMDDNMPVMTGPKAVRALRSLGYKGPIIGVTGNTSAADKKRFIDNGASDVMEKPVDVAVLADILQQGSSPTC